MITCSAAFDANMARAYIPIQPKALCSLLSREKGIVDKTHLRRKRSWIVRRKHVLIKGKGQKNVVSQHQYGTCTKCQEIKVKNSDGCPLGGIGWSEMKKDLGSIKKKNAFLFSFLFRLKGLGQSLSDRPRLLIPYSYSLRRTQSISRAMHISESAIW
jgi:hypothetical protein